MPSLSSSLESRIRDRIASKFIDNYQLQLIAKKIQKYHLPVPIKGNPSKVNINGLQLAKNA